LIARAKRQSSTNSVLERRQDKRNQRKAFVSKTLPSKTLTLSPKLLKDFSAMKRPSVLTSKNSNARPASSSIKFVTPKKMMNRIQSKKDIKVLNIKELIEKNGALPNERSISILGDIEEENEQKLSSIKKKRPRLSLKPYEKINIIHPVESNSDGCIDEEGKGNREENKSVENRSVEKEEKGESAQSLFFPLNPMLKSIVDKKDNVKTPNPGHVYINPSIHTYKHTPINSFIQSPTHPSLLQ
jgi:hypothetical protein